MSALQAGSMAVSKATQTEDDWDEVKADVKQLVNALRSLNPQSEEVDSKRKFDCDPQRTQHNLRPTNRNLRELVLRLVSMFTTFQSERKTFKFSKEVDYVSIWLPTFVNQLIVRIPERSPTGFWTTSPGKRLSGSRASEVEKFFMLNSVKASHGYQDFVHEKSNDWRWHRPDYKGDFNLYEIRSDKTTCKAKKNNTESLHSDLQTGYGHGVLCLIKAPVEGGVLGFHWVNFIVAQASRWHYLDSPASMHFGRVIYFLGVFAGAWPLRKERLGFALRKSLHHSFERWYLQVHFRYFADAAKPEKYEVTRGLQCTREKGKIASDSLDTSFYSFEEKRISVFGLISAEEYSSPQTTPAFYNVLALGETKFGDLDGYILKWQPGLQGTIAFQIALLASVDVWETEWNKVLDRIDACLQFQLGQTSSRTEVDAWMFDDNFERSRLYFTTLQILRLFGGCISTLSDDLRPLDDLFLKRSNFPMPNMRQNELQALRSNWELVRETQRIAQKNLSDRVLNKTEEIKGLRDGLLNASSLREAKASLRQANRSSEMSRYVLMFTVVTVLYLPPSFISTVFALDIFKKDPVQTKWEYKVSIVSVSLFTYTMALALVIATDWKNFRRRCSSRWVKFSTWWIKFFQWRGDSSSSENTTGTLDDFAADDFAVDEPASLAPEQGSKPEETRSAHEVGDEESGPLKAKRQWSSPFLGSGKSGESSGQKDKGKALEEIPMTAMYTPNKRGAGFVSEGPRRGYTTYITGLQIEET